MILLDPSAHPVIGHRGNRAHAPENTLESLQEAVALGVDAVEFDVQVSSDGVLLLMHDVTIDRTTSGAGAFNFGNIDTKFVFVCLHQRMKPRCEKFDLCG